MIRKFAALLASGILSMNICLADEGMWLVMHITGMTYEDMQKAGLRLTPEQIYSINNASLKDAIVVLNGGACTAEMISSEGLVLTNHHCAYGVIQSSSTVEKNLLEEGFWAMNREQEIYAEGMTASFLVRMEDVTDAVTAGLNDNMSHEDREKAIKTVSDSLVKLAEGENGYNANVRSMFAGNRFYLFVYNTYKDVRLVAAPPESIGKYGGDTDNWMWPRHTGDFSMLRIYADKDGKPADYSKDNMPLHPKHHLPVSLKGIKKNDYAMIMGYPGSTDRYLTSYGIANEIATTHRARIKLREERLGLYKQDMDADEAVRLKYASKYARISNYYKNSIGMVEALNKLKVADQKRAQEEEFMAWVNKDAARKQKYGESLSLIENSLKESEERALASNYFFEALYSTEIVGLAWRFNSLYALLKKDEVDQEKVKQVADALKKRVEAHFKDYNLATDKKAFISLLKMYRDDIPAIYHPEAFQLVAKKYKGDFARYADDVYSKSIFADQEKLIAFLDKPDLKTLEKDLAFNLSNDARTVYYEKILAGNAKAEADLEKGRRLFLAGLMEMQKNRRFYPDANSTMRLTYGNILDYKPRDAVHYDYYTTLEGVMEKEDPSSFEFIVPEKLKTLYENKNFGDYGEDGRLIVNFITNNDITGGNSGSPVINADGELIGCAFDGNWEALSGDIAFEDNLQRTIVCDIRYILFIVDKFAGASHLIKEMTLVKDQTVNANN